MISSLTGNRGAQLAITGGKMDKTTRTGFIQQWHKYFPNTDLPITYFYTDQVTVAELEDTVQEDRCLIGNLNRVRQGHTYVYSGGTPGCSGGKRYSGFSQSLRPNFEYFLSCGIPGQMEGERYKQSPELVRETMAHWHDFKAPGKYLVFKRWDKLEEKDEPLGVIFFAAGDVLAGLFTLANYDTPEPDGVIAPMGSGCSSILANPVREAERSKPRAVLGMFDVSARPYVPAHMLTFTVPLLRFLQMVANMDESFLITHSWQVVQERIRAGG
jgi:hypothetical protein